MLGTHCLSQDQEIGWRTPPAGSQPGRNARILPEFSPGGSEPHGVFASQSQNASFAWGQGSRRVAHAGAHGAPAIAPSLRPSGGPTGLSAPKAS
ncbi:hypothetical protein RR42_s1672 [Cupriavidus basilensis]|uniref:Uncharacterized protein n=1 Tax=Cupriavidus basilensis TaxID=68895 RepID=A0A0C4YL23_9BURK|nr:hypothetical protein RR42_s1672 [Cupriavidus basilensis]